ncbi:MAG: hypothetical protein PHU91_02120 [Candidatus Omnitrophica bacterium]|nr:hypothetical protein [Candidatus Omnitrophota bacterium]MDD5236451.1 hypothetical protein [Candidatus Omnitrophota bacterium]MDD5610513.1 hypothetical protein [Candidatus Omnitrophota bacterium]
MQYLILAILLFLFYFAARFILTSRKGYNIFLGLLAAVIILFCTLSFFSSYYKKMNALAVMLLLAMALIFYVVSIYRRMK